MYTVVLKNKLRTALLTAIFIVGMTTLVVYSHGGYVHDGSKAANKHLLHDTEVPDGHIPTNVNYGFTVIGQDTLDGISDGKYTDVWAHEGYAYVGTFQEPTCDRSGVYVSDIHDPANPTTVTMIKSPPFTRINDVKVHPVGDKDVLIMTLEDCGALVGQGNADQIGQGGISLWDVTDPTKPHALKQNFLDFPVHNTFPWTDGENTYLMIVDDVNIDDVHIADITKPQSPKLISTTGIGTWFLDGEAPQVAADGQLFTGVFAASLLHDIWVEQVNGQWQAVLSYWDAGFITLDVSDPHNPTFIGDSTYPDPDPVFGISPAEGNAHAAVFGGATNEFIFGGDEDFDSFEVTIKGGGNTFSATQGSDTPQIGADDTVVGDSVYVGLACNANEVPSAVDTGASIAIIQRGVCAFTTKAQNAEAAGYSAGIVFNRTGTDGCETSISMLVEAGIPMFFVARSAGFALLDVGGYDPGQCSTASGGSDGSNPAVPSIGTAGVAIDISADFDGWGYFHVLNNKMEDVTVPYGQGGDTRTVGYLGEIGYYAPAELADPALATGAGDLTMHNVEVDPSERNRSFISWYSLGMRALEYRPGHLHTNALGEGVISWNVHEVGRFIAEDGSNFWGVHVTEVDGEQYILGSDRNTGLWIFQFECEGEQSENPALYCNKNP